MGDNSYDEFAVVCSVRLGFDDFDGDGGNVASASKLSSHSGFPLLLVPLSNFDVSSFVTDSSSSSSLLHSTSDSSSSSISLSSGDSSRRFSDPSAVRGSGGSGRSD